MEEITKRLQSLEAQVATLQDLAKTERSVLFGLLHVLHATGVPLQDVIARIEQRSAFGRGAFQEDQPQTLAVFLDALRQIADALPPSPTR